MLKISLVAAQPRLIRRCESQGCQVYPQSAFTGAAHLDNATFVFFYVADFIF
jgi:hypothetical protein